MEGFVILILLLLLALLIMPIVALARSNSVLSSVRDLEQRISRLEGELKKTAKQAPDSVEEAEAKSPAPPEPAEETPATATPPPLPTLSAAKQGAAKTERAVTAPPQPAEAPPPPQKPPSQEPPPPSKPRPPFDWEQFMGAKLFAWIGGLALFLGFGFFVKYAFDRDLVPPELRVALGFAAGIGLLVGGFVMHRRKAYIITSHTLCATGILVLYVTTFACRAIYHFPLFGVAPTFLLMVLVTAVAFLLAVRLDAVVIAVLGLAGGFLTPLLILPARDQPFWLFSYIALLNVGLLTATLAKRWHFLAGLAAIGTLILQWHWFAESFAVSKGWIACGVFLGFAALQTGVAWFAKRRGQPLDWYLGAAAAMAGSALLFAGATLTFSRLATRPGVFLATLFGASLCLLALSLLRPGRPHFHAIGAAAGFFLLAAWIAGYVTDDLLGWILGASFLFALLHSATPLVMARLDPERLPPRWSHAMPLLSFALILLPVLRLDALSLLTWPVVLAIDILIVIVAVLVRAAWLVIGALGLTLAVLAFWAGSVAPSPDSLAGLLVVIGGFSVAIIVATFLLRARLQAVPSESDETASDSPPAASIADWEQPFAKLTPHLPSLSAVLPFALLLIVVIRLPLVSPSPVFGLATVLCALLLGLSYVLKNHALPLVGVLAVAGLQHAWQAQHLSGAVTAGITTGPLLWHIGFFLLFAAFPFACWKRFSGSLLPWVASAVSGPLHFFLVHHLVGMAWPNEFMGVIPALFAIPSLITLIVVIRRLPETAKERPAELAWFGGATLFFITLIFPIQFSREWITLGWALEGAALLWLFRRVPHPGLRLTGVFLLAASFVRLALNPAVLSYHQRAELPILNWYLYVFAATAACLFAGARLLRRPRHEIGGFNVPPWLYGMGTVLLFLLVNIEIADFFTTPGRSVLTFEFSGNFGRDMCYTIAWALFALILLAVGLFRRLSGARLAGLGLLAVALAKLFLHDLANLTSLYRIGALMATAVIAIVASLLYQKLLADTPVTENETIPEDEDETPVPPAG